MFQMPYTEPTVIKEKECNFVKGILVNARVGQFISFDSYYNISFAEDDEKHWTGIVNKLEGYARSKVNAIGYNISKGEKFDKFFIYVTGAKEPTFYGLLFINTKTGKTMNVYNINYEYTNLAVYINNAIHRN